MSKRLRVTTARWQQSRNSRTPSSTGCGFSALPAAIRISPKPCACGAPDTLPVRVTKKPWLPSTIRSWCVQRQTDCSGGVPHWPDLVARRRRKNGSKSPASCAPARLRNDLRNGSRAEAVPPLRDIGAGAHAVLRAEQAQNALIVAVAGEVRVVRQAALVR